MHDLNASERQMALNEVIFKKQMALFLKEINMHDLNASERQMALNEEVFIKTDGVNTQGDKHA